MDHFEFVIALILAVAVSLVLALVRRRPDTTIALAALGFFVLLFPVIWASGLWLGRLRPGIGGIPWLSYTSVAVVLLMLGIVLGIPPTRTADDPEPPTRGHGDDGDEGDGRTETSSSYARYFWKVAFWLLLCGAVFAIVVHYVKFPDKPGPR